MEETQKMATTRPQFRFARWMAMLRRRNLLVYQWCTGLPSATWLYGALVYHQLLGYSHFHKTLLHQFIPLPV